MMIYATMSLTNGLLKLVITEQDEVIEILDAPYTFPGDSVMVKLWPEAKISCQWSGQKWYPCFGFDGAWCLKLVGDKIEPQICYPEPK